MSGLYRKIIETFRLWLFFIAILTFLSCESKIDLAVEYFNEGQSLILHQPDSALIMLKLSDSLINLEISRKGSEKVNAIFSPTNQQSLSDLIIYTRQVLDSFFLYRQLAECANSMTEEDYIAFLDERYIPSLYPKHTDVMNYYILKHLYKKKAILETPELKKKRKVRSLVNEIKSLAIEGQFKHAKTLLYQSRAILPKDTQNGCKSFIKIEESKPLSIGLTDLAVDCRKYLGKRIVITFKNGLTSPELQENYCVFYPIGLSSNIAISAPRHYFKNKDEYDRATLRVIGKVYDQYEQICAILAESVEIL